MTEKEIWNKLVKVFSPAGVAGLMGNLYAESALRPNNLQNSYEKSLGYSDEAYTQAVDSGKYKNFVHDCAGYGLAQWTYWKRKQALLQYAQSVEKSIGDGTMQIDFLLRELEKDFPRLHFCLQTATDVKIASDIVMTQFENPADQSETAKAKRASYAYTYYNRYASVTSNIVEDEPELKAPALSDVVIDSNTITSESVDVTMNVDGKTYAGTLMPAC